jgi:hypothetical protein
VIQPHYDYICLIEEGYFDEQLKVYTMTTHLALALDAAMVCMSLIEEVHPLWMVG